MPGGVERVCFRNSIPFDLGDAILASGLRETAGTVGARVSQ